MFPASSRTKPSFILSMSTSVRDPSRVFTEHRALAARPPAFRILMDPLLRPSEVISLPGRGLPDTVSGMGSGSCECRKPLALAYCAWTILIVVPISLLFGEIIPPGTVDGGDQNSRPCACAGCVHCAGGQL